MAKYNIAILGATGLVGQTLADILYQRQFPIEKLYPLASHRSTGKTVQFGKKQCDVIDVSDFDFSNVHIAFFSAGSMASEKYASIAAEKGCVVIDNTSCFRYQDDVPLVVPEVNANRIEDYKNRNIIANPNCSTIQMLVALKPIYDAVGIKRINVATYQSVSGTGALAISELAKMAGEMLNGRSPENEVYPVPISFNVLPHIDAFQDNGYTREEMKMFWETRKILEDPNILVNATCVRVPVFYGHSEAIHLETKTKLTASDARQLLIQSPGIIVLDENEDKGYPTPLLEGSGTDPVYVGRIREDISHPLGLNLWVVADNIRKGAALNSVQIAEMLINEYYEY